MKKKYIVIPREKNAVLNGIKTSRGVRSFNNKTYMHINDPSEAREIDQLYGKNGTQDVYIAEDEQYARALNGEKWDVKSNLKETNVKVLHNYHFGASARFADAWEAFEKRRKDKPKETRKRRKSAEV